MNGMTVRPYCLEREQWLPKPIEEVFAFFSRPENLQTITPAVAGFSNGQNPTGAGEGGTYPVPAPMALDTDPVDYRDLRVEPTTPLCRP